EGTAGCVLPGVQVNDASGWSVSAAGDVNGDGIDDLIVGAFHGAVTQSDAGASLVVFGRDTSQSGNFPAVFPLASLLPGQGGDGSIGFVLSGIEYGEWSGLSVSAAGDVNGDGVDDLIIGAPREYDFGTGRAYVVFG